MIQQFINDGPYTPTDGVAVPYLDFCRALAAFLDDPVAQLHWLQKNDRVQIALNAIGYSTGPLGTPRKGQPSFTRGGIWIGNLSGPGSRSIAPGRRLILEDDILTVADLSATEQRELKKYQPETAA